MKKTLIALVFSLTLIFALAIFGASAASEGTPVSTAAEFEAMVSGGTYYLTNDIDLGGKDYANGIFGRKADTDGNGTLDYVGFSLTLDGNGYTVGNFTLSDVDSYHVGMFTELMGGQYLNIRDLNVGSAELPIKVTGANKASHSYAVLVGHLHEDSATYLKNVNVYGNVDVDLDTKAMYGIIVGKARSIVFENCTANGSMEIGTGASHGNYMNCAGFAGSVEADTTFINCTNNANITINGTTKEGRVGGFVGYCNAVIYMENCVNNGALTVKDGADYTSDPYIGGLISEMTKGVVIINCKNNGTLTCSNAERIGEIAAKTRQTIIAVGSSHNPDIKDCPIYANEAKKGIIIDNLDTVPANSTPISNKDEFLAMVSGGVYHLTADIDLGGQVFTDYVFAEFSGILNGCGHKIYNYTITGSLETSTDVGTFAAIAKNDAAIICNLQVGEAANPVKVIDLADKSPSSAQSKAVFVAVIGNNVTAAYIKNVDVYGTVDAKTTDKVNMGGFITYVRNVVLDDCTFSGSITNVTGPDHVSPNYYCNIGVFGANIADQGVYYLNCVNNADVTVGAIDGTENVRAVAFAAYSSSKPITLINCVNNGSMTTLNATLTDGTVTDGGIAAGLVGTAKCAVLMINCVNNGAINGNDVTGGLIGELGASKTALLINTENKGTVSATATSNGSLVGKGDGTVASFVIPVETPDTSDSLNIVAVISVAVVSIVGSAVVLTSIRKRREFNA